MVYVYIENSKERDMNLENVASKLAQKSHETFIAAN